MLQQDSAKTKILVFIGHYLPGFKSGGILRSVENIVNNFCDEFDFLIITRDRDLGDDEPYPHIKHNGWQAIGKAQVYYLDHAAQSLKAVCKLVNSTPCDLIYLNSFFDPLTVKVLAARKMGRIAHKPVILAPRGEFAWASLKIKYPKKLAYIRLSTWFRLYHGIIWHASSEHEQADIAGVMHIDSEFMGIARDLPVRIGRDKLKKNRNRKRSDDDRLHVVFLSRISPEKNLDYALNVLSEVQANVVFDIYGTTEDENYWYKCKQYISTLPDNIIVNYRGAISPDQSVATFAGYDMFLFPSGGENYGHVIAESLLAGTQVLISKNTPWLELEQQGLGWDFPLEDIERFVATIEQVAGMSSAELELKRMHVSRNIDKILINQQDYEDNRQLFLQASRTG